VRFRGHLELPHDPQSRLPVDLRVDDDVMSLTSGDEALGTWPTRSVRLKVREDGLFDLRVGDEKLLFAAEDSAAFKYTGFPAIMGTNPGEESTVLDKLKSRWRPKTAANGPVDPPLPAGADATDESPNWQPTEPGPELLEPELLEPELLEQVSDPSQSTKEGRAAPPLPPDALPEAGEQPEHPGPVWDDAPVAEAVWTAPAATSADSLHEEPAGASWTEPVDALPSDASPPHQPSETLRPTPAYPVSTTEPPQGYQEVLDRLAGVAVDVRDGTIEPARASAIAELVSAMCRVVELGGHAPDQLRNIVVMIDSGLGPLRSEDSP